MKIPIRLSRTSWIILIGGILVVAFASLGVARFDQFSEQEKLQKELAVAEKRLTTSQIKDITAKKQLLQEQLAQTQSQLEEIKSNLDRNVANIDVTSTVINIAHACNLIVVEINSIGVTGEKLAEVPCLVDRLEIVAAGDVDDLIYFVVSLNNGFDTGMVESAEIIVPELDTGSESETETGTETETEGSETENETMALADMPQISLNFAVYTYNGE